ncbi:MAG: hypothetical protein JOZ29_20990 [Deltaproteobacteria bacterium]|nr:hypothetical protein [Deltaproteobacteria bacterium]MBV8454722.1 hypothetical protein [Deltaproteobacteria bacterium]
MKRYVPLLMALFGALILQPIVVSLSTANTPLNLLIYVMMATAIYAMGPGKTSVAITAAWAFAIVVMRLLYEASSNVRLLIFSHLLSFSLMAVVAVTIVIRVFRAREVTADIIVGAICVYLAIGAAWSFFIFSCRSPLPDR